MERHAFAMKVKDDMMNSYRQKLGEIWKDLTLFLDRNQVKNFSIWNTERLIFGYYEKEDDAELNAEEKAVRDVLIEKMAETFEWISEPGQDMRLMYHNYGVIRENKELIRHRVFMTRLKDGCEEEYKARHDGLIAQRGDTVDPGQIVILLSGAQADIFLDMMKLILLWKLMKRRRQEKLL